MNETQLITYVIEKACSTQKQVQGALVAFFCDLKRILDAYLEGHIEGVDKRERPFKEFMGQYQAMEDEAQQELEKLRRRND
jgi:hypothetical protein